MKNGLRGFALMAAVCFGGQSPALAQAGGARLPIAEGAWVDAEVPCGLAEAVYAYYGGRIGELSAYSGEVEGLLEPVGSETLGEDGFTPARGGYDEYLHVKSLPNGRAVVRTGGEGATGRNSYADTVVRPCAPQSLPTSLRAALAPYTGEAVAGPATVAIATGDQPGAAVPPLGIATGYYAEGQEPCGGDGMLFYYDGRNYAWIDLQPFQGRMLEPVGQPRRAGGALMLDGSSMTVSSPTRFTWRDVNEMMGDMEMRWCSASAVRPSARLR